MKFVFDLDGTICFHGKPVSEQLLQALLALEAQGHQVIFASARPIRDLLPILPEDWHRHAMIGGNGSMTYQDGKLLSIAHFDSYTQKEILSLIKAYHATYLIDSDWDYAYTGPSSHPILQNLDPQQRAKKMELVQLSSMLKILILTADNMEELAADLHKLEVVVHSHGEEGVLDVSPKGIDKWRGLQQLGLTEASYTAFGNDANDQTMFQHAAYSVMIGANQQLAPYANEQIPFDDTVEDKIVKKLHELIR
ncbi:HAD-IIB family hydrolase [Gracilibacillus alcaliphilus]|uniref:HAD-IIB family hydrolase n=1 Tax=Gracilibacillus alcaliphilus TaxID=1401441 RepID=UPI00195A108D|nr:HAD-IIB family hydrolase [Gracilibacillus alcaliphilus]MBM7679048.1 Cof subfamily protein (haloacid dehalogenase superfamily) [Gracilibacillus alcaliphilus]